MTPALKRVFAIGLLSHVLAFCTLFTLISAVYPNGIDYTLSFLLTGLLVAYLMYKSTLTRTEQARKRFSVASIMILLIGFATMFFLSPIGDSISGVMIGCFVVLGFFLFRRIANMIADLKYVRHTLVDAYKKDVLFVVGLALLVLLFAHPGAAWTRNMMPFFVSFLVTRMVALSLASQLNKDNSMKKSIIEKWQDRLPFLLVGGALLLTWLVLTVGGSVWRLIVWLLTPLWYGLGLLAQWLFDLLSHSKFQWLVNKVFGGKKSPLPDPLKKIPPTHFVPPSGDWLWFQILIGIVLAGAIGWYAFKVIKRANRPSIQQGPVEIRDFISRALTKSGTRTWASGGPLTPMRKTYRKFLLAMQKQGYIRQESETAGELVGKIATASPELGIDMHELTDYYMRERYGAQQVDDHLTRANQIVHELADKKEKQK